MIGRHVSSSEFRATLNFKRSFRLFSQPTTDDASHDEALSNRIAALNLLDLGLGHLGIDIGEVNEPDLNAVVKACGESKCETSHFLNSLRNAMQCSVNWILVDVPRIKPRFSLPPIKL
jgi:hypothetical protein